MQNMKFPWSDNWWIENDKAWFCAGEMAALFCVDMNSGQCEFVARIPECVFNNFRLYSYCIKFKNCIFCLPNIGNYIWCYDLGRALWEKIEAGNEKQIFIRMDIHKYCFEKLWLLESEAGEIFEFNMQKRVIEKKYELSQHDDLVFNEYVLVEKELFCVAGDKIYCIDIVNGDTCIYKINDVKTELYNICYDGFNFWLSGYCKEIYIWNPIQGLVKTITEFPEQFGIYLFNSNSSVQLDYNSFYSGEFPFFSTSVSLGKYIWYIPLQSSEIIYIDKETYKMHILELEEERENEESLKRAFCLRYLVQYIREDRYIGLYSLKRCLIFEIDTLELCIKIKNYELNDQALLSVAKEMNDNDKQSIFRENREMDQMLFWARLMGSRYKKNNLTQKIGEHIYHMLR